MRSDRMVWKNRLTELSIPMRGYEGYTGEYKEWIIVVIYPHEGL